MAEFVLSGQELFGRYARIAYGHALDGKQDYHIYKCIRSFMSNCYCDVPLTYQTENNCHKHDNIVEVVNVIHCGIDESKVIRVARNDIELIPAADAVEVVRCRDCKHAVEIEKDYISALFIDGTKQCELGRADTLFGYSIITNDGFCDSGERKYGDGNG